MSEDRIEIVRRVLDGVGHRDLSVLLEHADPGIEFQPLLSVWQRTYTGREGIEQWFADVSELWEEFEVLADSFRDLGEGNLLVHIRWRGRPKGGEMQIDGPAAGVVRFHGDGDRVAFVGVYLDEQRALDAVTAA